MTSLDSWRCAGTCRRRESLAVVAVAMILASAPAAAQSPMDALAYVAMGVELVPAVGAETQLREGHTTTERFLLSWPLQVPLVWHDDSAASNDKVLRLYSVHRLVVAPELRLAGATEFGGRVGYRFIAPAFFAGFGASYADSLGVSASPEIGVRWFTKDALLGWFLAARADAPVTGHFGERLAASLSLGLLLY